MRRGRWFLIGGGIVLTTTLSGCGLVGGGSTPTTTPTAGRNGANTVNGGNAAAGIPLGGPSSAAPGRAGGVFSATPGSAMASPGTGTVAPRAGEGPGGTGRNDNGLGATGPGDPGQRGTALGQEPVNPEGNLSGAIGPGTALAPQGTGNQSGLNGLGNGFERAGTVLRPGDAGPAVTTLQRQLNAAGFWAGTPDGIYGEQTRQAVLALQKTADLLPDGVFGPATAAALARGVRPVAQTRTGQVLEIDLGRQLLTVVANGRVVVTVNIDAAPGGRLAPLETRNGRGRGRIAVQGRQQGRDGQVTATLQVRSARDAMVRTGSGVLYRPLILGGRDGLGGLGGAVALSGGLSTGRGIGLRASGNLSGTTGVIRISEAAMDLIWRENLAPLGTTVVIR